MSGRDVIGIAKTGSGKTMAYTLPMLRHALDQDELAAGDGPNADVAKALRKLEKYEIACQGDDHADKEHLSCNSEALMYARGALGSSRNQHGGATTVPSPR